MKSGARGRGNKHMSNLPECDNAWKECKACNCHYALAIAWEALDNIAGNNEPYERPFIAQDAMHRIEELG